MQSLKVAGVGLGCLMLGAVAVSLEASERAPFHAGSAVERPQALSVDREIVRSILDRQGAARAARSSNWMDGVQVAYGKVPETCTGPDEFGALLIENGEPNGTGGLASQIGGPFPDPPFFGGPEVRAADDFYLDFDSSIRTITWYALEDHPEEGESNGINWTGEVRLEIRLDEDCQPGVPAVSNGSSLVLEIGECSGEAALSGACVTRELLDPDGPLELQRIRYTIEGLEIELEAGRYWLILAPISNESVGQSFWEASDVESPECSAVLQGGPLGLNDWTSLLEVGSLNFAISGCNLDPVANCGEGNCMLPRENPGCEVGECCAAVCSADGFAYCCIDAWDEACVEAAVDLCDGLLPGCNTPLPADTVFETDACGENTNGGCEQLDGGKNQVFPFEVLPLGDFTFLGTIWTAFDGKQEVADSDWFQFELTENSNVSLSFQAAFPGRLAIVPNAFDGDPTLEILCEELSEDDVVVELVSSECGVATFEGVLPAGIHLLVVLPDPDAGDDDPGKLGLSPLEIPCGSGNEYIIDVVSGPAAACGDADAGDCFEANKSPFCDDLLCCKTVCAIDPFCCDTEWDLACVDTAHSECGVPDENNLCENATSVEAPSTVEGNLLLADWSGAVSSCVENDMQPDRWYLFEAPRNGTLQLSTCGSSELGGLVGPFDTTITVYDGACPKTGTPAGLGEPGAGAEIACNSAVLEGNLPDACNDFLVAGGGLPIEQDAALQVTLEADQVVYIRVSASIPGLAGELPGDLGSFLLHIDFINEDELEETCLGDLDFDGTVDVFDLLLLLDNWGPCGKFDDVCLGDLNENDAVDVFDLLILLDNWGDCPDDSLACGSPAAGNCCQPGDTPFCDDEECCQAVCAIDPFCCAVRWDEICATNDLFGAVGQCSICATLE